MSTVRIQVRRGTASDWTTANPTLAAGEVGFDTTSNKMKVGDGSTAWSTLPYISSDAPGVSEIAQDAIAQALSMGNGISKAYDDAANTITLTNTGVLSFNTRTGAVTLSANDVNTALGYTAANAADLSGLGSQTATDISNAITTAENYTDNVVGALTTSNIAEGSNLYFTPERAQDSVAGAMVAGNGIAVDYNDAANTITVTNNGVRYLSVDEQQLKINSHTGSPTLSLSDSVLITNNLGVGANLIVGGNLQVNGTTTTINSQTLSITDNLIYLNQPTYATVTAASKTSNTVTYTVNDIGHMAVGNIVVIAGATPSAYNISISDNKTITAINGNTFTVSKTVSPAYTSGGTVDAYAAAQPDLGIVAGYHGTDNVHHHSGLYRDAAAGGAWTFFDGLTSEPGVTIDKNDASFALATVTAGRLNANTIQMSSGGTIYGNVIGNIQGSADTLTTPRNINGVSFNGSANITIKSSTTNPLTIGTGLSGTSFDGTTATTIAIDTNVVVTKEGSQTLKNKVLSGSDNTFTAIPNSSLANNSITIGSTNVALGATASTVADLNLTSPVFSTIKNTGTLSLPTSTDTLVGRATTDTLTNKSISGSYNTFSNIGNSSLVNSGITIGSTQVSLGGTFSTIAGLTLTSPTIATISNTGTLSLPTSTDTLVGRATIDTLTNKSISGSVNTLTNIPNSALTNSSISVNGTLVSLGGSVSGLATNASPTFTGTVTLPLTTAGYVTTTSGGVVSSIATIPNAGLTNSKVTVGSTDINLGGSATTIAGLTSVTSTGFTGALTGNVTGNVTGNADTATKLATARNINGVAFDGSAAITITAANPNALTIGTGLSGTSYTGSGAVTIAIDSTVATLTGTQTLTNKTLSAAVATGGITHNGSTSGTIVLQASAVAGSNTLTLPAATDTLVGKATTDTLTNKTLDTAGTGNVLKINGTQVSAVTGTGSVVLAASPTLTGTVSAAAVTTTGDVTVGGNLTVNGTTTTINSTTLNTTEQVLVISNTATPTDVTANGAGITIKGATDKTIKWYSSTGAVTFSENIDLASGKTYKINGTTVLSATAVGGQTIPASAIVGLTDTQTLTNKTISGSSNTLSNIANSSLTNSTISGVALGSSLAALTTGTGLTGASYNGSGAITYAIDTTVVATLTGTQTLTNKTLTTPSMTTPTVSSGTLTVAAAGVTFSDATVQTTAGVPSITTIATAVAANNTTYYPSQQRDYMVPISGTYTLTIAPDGTNTAPIGTSVDFYQSAGTGGAFAAGAGVTILSTPGLKLRTTGSVATIMKTAANTWLLFGDLSA
jgi:Major tropism determinant N-terminal domain